MADIRRELLEEQFSDAALLLLMDKYAEAEGSELLEAYLESGTGIPESLDRACQKKIQTFYKETEKSALLRRTVYRAAKIAAVFAVCIFLSVQLVLSVEAFRIPVLNFLINKHPNSTEFLLQDNSRTMWEGVGDVLSIMRSVPPDGYTLVEKYSTASDTMLDNNSIINVFYQNPSEDRVVLASYSSSGTFHYDTEDAEVSETTVNGMTASYIQKNGTRTMIWLDPNQMRLYEIHSTSMEENAFMTYVYQMATLYQSVNITSE